MNQSNSEDSRRAKKRAFRGLKAARSKSDEARHMRLGSQLGIHWNFFVYMMLFMLMLIILLWSFQIVFFEEIYKVIKIKET